MRREISRIPAGGLSPGAFFDRFYASETPVVVSGCDVATTMSVEELRHKYMKPSARESGWYDSPLTNDVAEQVVARPAIAGAVLSRPDIVTRGTPVRVWLHPRGHRSFFHYDGNSLCGLNLQVWGRKSWTLISPDAALPCSPFNFVMAVSRSFEPDPARYDVYRFDTEPGDLVFLPRYWVHSVEAHSEANLNINWVWTPTYPNRTSLLGRRESELLRLRQLVPVLDKVMASAAASYGGGGDEIVDAYTAGVPKRVAVSRLIAEIAKVPRFAIRIPSLLDQLNEFKENNFKVPVSPAVPDR